MSGSTRRVWVAGEALMDLIPFSDGERRPMVGGGPANTAKAISRLGHLTQFIGGISSDTFGQMIDRELRDSGVDLSLVYRGELPTALAIATIDNEGLARYDFELDGTMSFAFNRSWLPDGEPDVIHVGSVATLLEPGASELLSWLQGKSVPIVFDPNVRPSIETNRETYRLTVERWIDVATIIKLSEDDMGWLFGDRSEESVVRSWLSHGTSIVVVTRAEKGLRAYIDGYMFEVPAVSVNLIDSVGAGDTIGAVLVEGLLNYGLAGLNEQTLGLVLSRATKAASITCSRAGANPPWLEELDRD